MGQRVMTWLFLLMGAPSLWAQEFEQVNTTSPQTLTNKTFVSPVLTTPSLSNPTITGTISGTPTIPGPTISNPTITGTISGSATISTPTLTNPTMSGTVSGGTYSGATLSSPVVTGTVTGGATYTTPIISKSTEASLPAAAAEGKLIWLDDGPQGLIGDFGTKLAHLFGYNWLADVYSDLGTALSAIGSTQATLAIGKSITTNSVTCPSTLTLFFVGQSQISVNLSQTVTINCPIIAPERQIFTGSGTVIFGSASVSTVPAEWWPNTTGGFQAAINALASGQMLSCTKNVTGTGWTITNKSRIAIAGKCTLTLASASNTAFILQLVGTVDDLEISGLTLVGENNSGATYTQTAIGNSSGQTISNVRTHDLTIRDINVGISYNAALSGTFTGGSIYRNTISNIIGTASGQGYGIHLAGATGITVEMNEITNAQRHSIYHAIGDNTGARIIANRIKGHRSTVANQSVVCAVVISRSSGVLMANNIIEGGYDCQLEISHVTSDSRNASDISVINNQFLDRKNLVYAIVIGEQVLPTTNSTSHIVLEGNLFRSAYTNVTSNADIIVFNGSKITYRNNTHYITGVTSTAKFVSLGHNSYIGATADCTDTVWSGNSFFASGSSLTDVRGIEVESDITTGTSRHSIFDNYGEQITAMVQMVATRTNPYLVFNELIGGPRYGVYTAGDTTPTVYNADSLTIANAAPVTITQLDDGKDGQRVTLKFRDGNTTIQHNANIRLSGGSNFVSTANDTLTLINDGGTWVEASRSVNA